MKKYLTLVFVLIICVLLTGCGSTLPTVNGFPEKPEKEKLGYAEKNFSYTQAHQQWASLTGSGTVEDEGDMGHAKFINLGLILGAGLDYPLMGHYLVGEVRYDLGITPFHQKSESMDNVKHRVFSILVGVDI
ncbi:MAG: hypothetical protein WC703_05530 [Candidatus Neomarinimicrobiota bacterium]